MSGGPVRISFASARDAAHHRGIKTGHRVVDIRRVGVCIQVEGQTASVSMAEQLREDDRRHATGGMLGGEEPAKVVQADPSQASRWTAGLGWDEGEPGAGSLLSGRLAGLRPDHLDSELQGRWAT